MDSVIVSTGHANNKVPYVQIVHKIYVENVHTEINCTCTRVYNI